MVCGSKGHGHQHPLCKHQLRGGSDIVIGVVVVGGGGIVVVVIILVVCFFVFVSIFVDVFSSAIFNDTKIIKNKRRRLW
jgi:hypothetical protein